VSKKGKLSILVIDDEPGLQFVLGKGLKNAGFYVDTADNLEEGEKAIASKKYVCIFLDIILPDGSGLDLLKKMSSEPDSPAVVVMTAEATMQNAIEAMRRGAYDYLTKPFDLDDVEKLVK
jgi:two-component system nitrogen regulation response regulator GlnG